MKQIFFSTKGITIEKVPEPIVKDNMVLIKNIYSCVSVGTELSGLRSIKQNLITRAINKPKILLNVFNSLKKSGIKRTGTLIRDKISKFYEVGYSSSGIVEDVGKKIKGFKKGDFVACCGGGYASHAEKILVPENLLVKVSDSQKLQCYSTVALGSIALQGVRRSSPSLGEVFLVVGLGFIGQVTIQILRNSGIEVYGLEPNSKFRKIAEENGFKNIYKSFNELQNKIPNNSGRRGFDCIMITASSDDDDIINNSFKYSRKKGRIVIVGDTGLNLQRDEFYKKEIDLLISTSYGPGRYDEEYEEKGLDYPIEYVRWTMNRNMQVYLNLIKEDKISIKNLIQKVSVIDHAPALYNSLLKKDRPLSALIEYKKIEKYEFKYKDRVLTKNTGKLSVALVGVGSFSEEIVIPSLKRLGSYCSINFLCVNKPSSVLNLEKKYQNLKITNNLNHILKDKTVDIVFISTRHNTHFEIIKEVLKKNKSIFVEKPLCTSLDHLREIQSVLKKNKSSILVTGFNRRFSKPAKILKDFVKKEGHPVFLNYTVNADKIPKDSWIYTNEGAGRNIGEACHFYDLILYILDDEYISVNAKSLVIKNNSDREKTDNFSVLISFQNGSIAQLNYMTCGSLKQSKETIEIRATNKTIKMDDFKTIQIYDKGRSKKIFSSNKTEKGHYNQYKKFFEMLKKNQYSISLSNQIQAMQISFEVQDQI